MDYIQLAKDDLEKEKEVQVDISRRDLVDYYLKRAQVYALIAIAEMYRDLHGMVPVEEVDK